MSESTRRFRAIVESPAFRGSVGSLGGEQLQRVPRGFPTDPSTLVSSPQFSRGVLHVFRRVAPLTPFLNEPSLMSP